MQVSFALQVKAQQKILDAGALAGLQLSNVPSAGS
jgi:hypothetical protein